MNFEESNRFFLQTTKTQLLVRGITNGKYGNKKGAIDLDSSLIRIVAYMQHDGDMLRLTHEGSELYGIDHGWIASGPMAPFIRLERGQPELWQSDFDNYQYNVAAWHQPKPVVVVMYPKLKTDSELPVCRDDEIEVVSSLHMRYLLAFETIRTLLTLRKNSLHELYKNRDDARIAEQFLHRWIPFCRTLYDQLPGK